MPKRTASDEPRDLTNLTQKQSDRLWGVTSPYSEARLIFESRIMDTAVSRVFIEVQVSINPLTFETILEHRDEFADDVIIQQLLDHSEYLGEAEGYVSLAFCQHYVDSTVLIKAQEHLEFAKETIFKMHNWMYQYLSKQWKN